MQLKFGIQRRVNNMTYTGNFIFLAHTTEDLKLTL